MGIGFQKSHGFEIRQNNGCYLQDVPSAVKLSALNTLIYLITLILRLLFTALIAIMYLPKYANGDPRNVALIGHWDGWQPFSTSIKHSCGMLKILAI